MTLNDKWCETCGFLPCRCEKVAVKRPLTPAERLAVKFAGFLNLSGVDVSTGRTWAAKLEPLLVNRDYDVILRVMEYGCTHSPFWARVISGYNPKGTLDVMGFFVKKFEVIEGQMKGDEKYKFLEERRKKRIVHVPNAVEHEEI